MDAITRQILAAFLTIGLASASRAGALEDYRKLQCDPRGLAVQTTEPLRFAAIATCYKLPKSFVHDGWVELVAVDVDAGTVRLVDLWRDDDAGKTLHDDGHGGWRWVARARPHADPSRALEAWVLPASASQPQLIGRVELPFDVEKYLSAYRGERCVLIGGARRDHALVNFVDGGVRLQPVAGIRRVRLWHPQHQAFVVQTDENSPAVHELLDCDGRTRPLPEADAARFTRFPLQEIVISSRGDWLIHNEAISGGGDEIVVLQGDRDRTFGPFEAVSKGCPDICDEPGIPLLDPQWSPGGQVFMADHLFAVSVVSAAELKKVAGWEHRDDSAADYTVLLSDSLAMQLSKKRGVIFHRW